MGERIEFAVNGSTAGGYLARPESATGAAVMVIQEWWGLVPQIRRVCDRLAEAGYVALAPDLFHGEVAEHDEMDKAGELMNSLPAAQAAKDMSGAITALLDHEASTGASVGVVGFCMGGKLSLMIGALEGDRVAAIAPYYGAPLGADAPDWSNLTATVRGHFAELDDFFPPDAVSVLASQLRAMGKDVEFTIHPGTGHGFTNEEDPLGTYDAEASAIAWAETLGLLETCLG